MRSLIGKGGEEMQFEEIYARYYKEVYYYLLSLDGNRETAEELTQETFFRAMKAIHKFKGELPVGNMAVSDCKTYLLFLEEKT